MDLDTRLLGDFVGGIEAMALTSRCGAPAI